MSGAPSWRETLLAVVLDCRSRAEASRSAHNSAHNADFLLGSSWAFDVIADEYELLAKASPGSSADAASITRQGVKRIREILNRDQGSRRSDLIGGSK